MTIELISCGVKYWREVRILESFIQVSTHQNKERKYRKRLCQMTIWSGVEKAKHKPQYRLGRGTEALSQPEGIFKRG